MREAIRTWWNNRCERFDAELKDDFRELGVSEEEIEEAFGEDEQQDTFEIQLNGLKCDEIRISADASRQAIEDAALASDKMQKYLAGREPKKVIVVPGRLVNIMSGDEQWVQWDALREESQ